MTPEEYVECPFWVLDVWRRVAKGRVSADEQ